MSQVAPHTTSQTSQQRQWCILCCSIVVNLHTRCISQEYAKLHRGISSMVDSTINICRVPDIIISDKTNITISNRNIVVCCICIE